MIVGLSGVVLWIGQIGNIKDTKGVRNEELTVDVNEGIELKMRREARILRWLGCIKTSRNCFGYELRFVDLHPKFSQILGIGDIIGGCSGSIIKFSGEIDWSGIRDMIKRGQCWGHVSLI